LNASSGCFVTVVELIMRPTLAFSALLALGLGATAGAQPLPRPLPAPPFLAPGPAMPAPDFIRGASGSDEYERQAGRLGEARAFDPRVRDFAQMMVRDHTHTTVDLQRAIRSEGRLPPPPPPFTPEQATMLTQLRASGGRAFDWIYMDQQIRAHETTLQLMLAYAQNGRDPVLRQVAETTLPIIRQHLELARTLRRHLGR
jgi:putative membrane protein